MRNKALVAFLTLVIFGCDGEAVSDQNETGKYVQEKKLSSEYWVDDKKKEFSEITLENTKGRNLRFIGKLIGEAEGKEIIWERKELYITLAGNYVARKVWIPLPPFYKKQSEAKVLRNQEEVFKFFGNSWTSKEVYKMAGIEDTIDVE